MNPDADTHLFGQEVNPETFAICKSDLFMKSEDGRDAENILFGSTLSNDRHGGAGFDYLLEALAGRPPVRSLARSGNHDASRGIQLPQNSGPLSDPADAGTLERKASAMGQQPEADGTAGPPNETVCSEGHGRLISDWRPSPPRPSGLRFGAPGMQSASGMADNGFGKLSMQLTTATSTSVRMARCHPSRRRCGSWRWGDRYGSPEAAVAAVARGRRAGVARLPDGREWPAWTGAQMRAAAVSTSRRRARL